jgi:hypothetical protein
MLQVRESRRDDNAETLRVQRHGRGTDEVRPPWVFLEERLQTIENKGNEGRKERKERVKRLRDYEKNGFATEAQRALRGFVAEQGTPPWRWKDCGSY